MSPDEVEFKMRDAQNALTGLNAAIYHEMAADYDRHLTTDCEYGAPAFIAKLMSAIVKDNALYLELAAGTGLIAQALKDAEVPVRLVAADICLAMLEQADQSNYTGLVRLDATCPLPFPQAVFDGALFILLMEHIAEPSFVFNALTPVIKDQGILLFTFIPSETDCSYMLDHKSTLMAHPPAMIQECLKNAGFNILRELPVKAYKHAKIWTVHHVVIAMKGDAAMVKE